ncbi:MAG: nucleotidyl transferase AbiEii/AbiGii toxin family protein [Peptostreptococcaceae bacterium]|nr:nucleotidyl transferase AbiEii/AbiGii toxin family protein [Peptostreptococcaceae bacterium]
MALHQLSESSFSNRVVFKGGTSLSKCFPNSIERFSEDIDLTYDPQEDLSDKHVERDLKSIEKILSSGFKVEKIIQERNPKNKSSYVWLSDENKDDEKIKLEIGASVRPHPFSKKVIKSYIQEYLEYIQMHEEIEKLQLQSFEINVLHIERTFIDKILSVKRHALCGTLASKVRHIYDVVKLYSMDEIHDFMLQKDALKSIIQLTKQTDREYLSKRDLGKEYNPSDKYEFDKWREKFDKRVQKNYESLHETLLYTDKKQDFAKAIRVFEEINMVFDEIGE